MFKAENILPKRERAILQRAAHSKHMSVDSFISFPAAGSGGVEIRRQRLGRFDLRVRLEIVDEPRQKRVAAPQRLRVADERAVAPRARDGDVHAARVG